jgi:hypothetical protein
VAPLWRTSKTAHDQTLATNRFAIVADEQMNVSSIRSAGRYAEAAARCCRGGCRQRDTCGCVTTFQFSKSFAQRGWCGRIPECTMSGLLNTTCARARTRAARSCVCHRQVKTMSPAFAAHELGQLVESAS